MPQIRVFAYLWHISVSRAKQNGRKENNVDKNSERLIKTMTIKECNHLDTTKELEELIKNYLELCNYKENESFQFDDWETARKTFIISFQLLKDKLNTYLSSTPSKENAMELKQELCRYDLILDAISTYLEQQQVFATRFPNQKLIDLAEHMPKKNEKIEEYLSVCFSYVETVFLEIETTYKQGYSLNEIDDYVMLMFFGLYTPLTNFWCNEMEKHHWFTKKEVEA